MATQRSRSMLRNFGLGALLSIGVFTTATAQIGASETREQQAAQLRVAVERRISALDDEYAERAGDLRDQFDARRRELEENAESEFVLSNAMAPISRVYQDSMATLQREINARKDSVYAAQNQANGELNTRGEISPETWARISATPLNEYPLIAPPTAANPEPATAVATQPTLDEEETPAAPALAQPAPATSDCAVRWYPDRDRDLFGDAEATAIMACYPVRPSGFVDNNYDCDDRNPTVNPITGHCTDVQ